MIDEKKLRVFIYIRVSTQEQANEGYSIAAQEERLRAYAKARGYIIVKVYTDPAYSGANIDRPALKEMIKGIEQGMADLILVYKLDRLSRSQKDTLYLIEDVFLKNNVDFVSMNESFDTSTPFGRAMIGILSVFAQLEREQIRERSMMGLEQRAKEGKWHGGGGGDRIITGYDYIDGELQINEYEAACVKYIFDLHTQGVGLRRVYEMANAKYPGVISAESTAWKIIRNPVYIAKIRHKGNLYEGIHEPLISEKQFYETQEIIKKRATTSDPFTAAYLFTGLMFCGHCGARMFGRTGGRLKDGTPMKYYTCHSRAKLRNYMVKDTKCTKKGERKEPLEEYLIGEIMKLKEMRLEDFTDKDDRITGNIAALEKELFSIDKRVSKLVTLFSLDSMPIEALTKQIADLNKMKADIEEHIEEAQEKLELKDLEDVKKTVSQLSTFDWDNEETSVKRLLVAKLINKITVSNDNITVEWAF